MRVVIVDDEAAGLESLRVACATHADLQIVAECRSGVEGLEVIRRERPDLAFLDIQMKPLTGLDIVMRLGDELEPVIVFVTAYDQHAVRAFELNAIDYLLKPFDVARFDRTLARARQRLGSALTEPLRSELRKAVALAARQLRAELARSPADAPLVLDVDGRLCFIDPQDIDHVVVERNYVTVTVRGEAHVLRGTLDDLERRLDPRRLIRISRSVIVNLTRIASVERWFHGEYRVTLKDGREFKTGRSYRERLEDLLGRQRGA